LRNFGKRTAKRKRQPEKRGGQSGNLYREKRPAQEGWRRVALQEERRQRKISQGKKHIEKLIKGGKNSTKKKREEKRRAKGAGVWKEKEKGHKPKAPGRPTKEETFRKTGGEFSEKNLNKKKNRLNKKGSRTDSGRKGGKCALNGKHVARGGGSETGNRLKKKPKRLAIPETHGEC